MRVSSPFRSHRARAARYGPAGVRAPEPGGELPLQLPQIQSLQSPLPGEEEAVDVLPRLWGQRGQHGGGGVRLPRQVHGQDLIPPAAQGDEFQLCPPFSTSSQSTPFSPSSSKPRPSGQPG